MSTDYRLTKSATHDNEQFIWRVKSLSKKQNLAERTDVEVDFIIEDEQNIKKSNYK